MFTNNNINETHYAVLILSGSIMHILPTYLYLNHLHSNMWRGVLYLSSSNENNNNTVVLLLL